MPSGSCEDPNLPNMHHIDPCRAPCSTGLAQGLSSGALRSPRTPRPAFDGEGLAAAGGLTPARGHLTLRVPPAALSGPPSPPSPPLPAQLGLLGANPAPREHAARRTKRAFLPPGTQREWTFALESGATKALAQAEECVAGLQPHVNGACARNTKGCEEAEPPGR